MTLPPDAQARAEMLARAIANKSGGGKPSTEDDEKRGASHRERSDVSE